MRRSLAGTAATGTIFQDGIKYDLMIAAISALTLILPGSLMFITCSLRRCDRHRGPWRCRWAPHLGCPSESATPFGIPLYWIVLALAVILLLAVGSDYNLLLISRFKEELDAGINTGIIRAMAGSGAVVTSAGLCLRRRWLRSSSATSKSSDRSVRRLVSACSSTP